MIAITNQTIHILKEILPVFLFAVVASAILDRFLPHDYLEKNFTKPNLLTLVNASFLGALIPLCTCGMIPLVVKLVQRGLNWRILVAFLVAGNACSIPALWLTTVMGYNVVLIRLLASVAYGVLVALVFAWILPKDFSLQLKSNLTLHDDCCENHCHSSKAKLILDDVLSMCRSFLPWIIVAALIAAVFDIYMMQGALDLVMQSTPWLSAIVAFPFYFCAGADVPISRELLAVGLPLGTVMSFMLASPGLNLTSLLVYQRCVGWKQALNFVLVSYLVAVGIGYILNLLLSQ